MLQVGKRKRKKKVGEGKLMNQESMWNLREIICQEPGNKVIREYKSGGSYGTERWMNAYWLEFSLWNVCKGTCW